MNNYQEILLLTLIIIGCFLYLMKLMIVRHKKRKTNNDIIYQDGKKHVLTYKKIPVYQHVPFHDFQYVYYLLSLIEQLPDDLFVIIYIQLIKWKNENYLEIKKENDIFHLHFLQEKVPHRIENNLYQKLYEISENYVLDFYTLKMWFQNDYQNIMKWCQDYLQDKEYQLRNEGTIINGQYSLEVYEDLQKLIGYKKYLNSYCPQIKDEEPYLYALLFVIDVPKPDMYLDLVMPQNPHFFTHH